MLHTSDNLTYTEAFEGMKKIVGPRAIQTVKVCTKYINYSELIEYVLYAFDLKSRIIFVIG